MHIRRHVVVSQVFQVHAGRSFACQGIKAAVSYRQCTRHVGPLSVLVHSMMSAGSDYAEHDHQLAATFARAARNAGVKRIIYLGGLGETPPDVAIVGAKKKNVTPESAIMFGVSRNCAHCSPKPNPLPSGLTKALL